MVAERIWLVVAAPKQSPKMKEDSEDRRAEVGQLS